MKTLAILPVKNLNQSKSRLSPAMNRQQRESLTSHLLRRTIGILKVARGIDDILLVSRDEKVSALALSENVRFLSERGTGLNQALEQATRWSVEYQYSAILILPLDLPLLTEEDIDSMLRMSHGMGEIVIIAPDQELQGTNALLVKPPGTLTYQFGLGSFQCHCQQFRDRNIESRIYRSAGTGFDLDSPLQYQSILPANLAEFNSCRKP